MSNKSSVSGKYWRRALASPSENYTDIKNLDERAVRYDDMILRKQRKEAMRKRKQERQNKRKGRR